MHVFPGEKGLKLLSQQFILIVFVQGLAKQSTRVRMVRERMLLVQPKASTALVVRSVSLETPIVTPCSYPPVPPQTHTPSHASISSPDLLLALSCQLIPIEVFNVLNM